MAVYNYAQRARRGYEQQETDWEAAAAQAQQRERRPGGKGNKGTENPNSNKAGPGTTSGAIDEVTKKYPNAWWSIHGPAGKSGIPQATLGEFASDSGAVARLWATQQGYGDNTLTTLKNWSDPTAVLHGLGFSRQIDRSPAARLNMVGDLYSKILGTGQQGTYVDPQTIMRNVTSARTKYDKEGNAVGQPNTFTNELAGPGLTPQQQVENTIRYIGSSMQGLLPRDTLSSYLRMLQQAGQQFILQSMQNPTNKLTFNRYLGQTYGPSGGLG